MNTETMMDIIEEAKDRIEELEQENQMLRDKLEDIGVPQDLLIYSI